MEKHAVVPVTTPSTQVAAVVARALVKQKLAACVNITPSVTSIYTWNNALCEDEEVQLVIKTTRNAYDDVFTLVQDLHPYDVPEIISLPIIAGSQDYLDWLDKAVETDRLVED